MTLLGNECNFRGALSNAFTPFWLKSTGSRGDSHTDLWSWAGFWAVLHGFRFWRAGLRFPFLGLLLSTGGSSWGAHGGVWAPLWQLQLISPFIVNLFCALMGEQTRNSWLCNKISCLLVTATSRIQDQQRASQGAAQVSINVPGSTDWTSELSLATEMPTSLYKMSQNIYNRDRDAKIALNICIISFSHFLLHKYQSICQSPLRHIQQLPFSQQGCGAELHRAWGSSKVTRVEVRRSIFPVWSRNCWSSCDRRLNCSVWLRHWSSRSFTRACQERTKWGTNPCWNTEVPNRICFCCIFSQTPRS